MADVALDPSIEIDPSVLPDLNSKLLPLVRANRLAIEIELSDDVVRVDHLVPGDPDIVVRVHTPRLVDGAEPSGPLPCLYSIHGGGYVLGSYEMDDAKFDRWCPRLGMIGVAVEYRLAPETPHPGPLEDCYAGLKWVYDNATDLGIDQDKIGITGVSAGGGLCAGLALLVRDRGEIPVQFQLLDCPMIDDRQGTPSSQIDNLVVWSKTSNAFGWSSYLGDLYRSDDIPIYAAAARASDLSGLPEAYVCVGGADGFRDEDMIYAMRLYDAGVPTEFHLYPGAPHGVVGFAAGTEIARRYTSDQVDWLRRQLERLAS